jgi:rRNA small subunit pseudouridine methyltransferase Nep1
MAIGNTMKVIYYKTPWNRRRSLKIRSGVMIHLLFADSALELAPEELLKHPAIRKYKKRFNKGKEILLDDSYHHSAMKGLKNWERRGRPDIVHFCLLSALGSPLCREGKLEVHVHTYDGNIIYFDSKTRLPRNYQRFKGLMEEVLKSKKSKNDLVVMKENMELTDFFSNLGCKSVIGLSSKGEKRKIGKIITEDNLKENMGIVIGAFPKGEFSENVASVINDLVSIYSESLDAWVVTSRILGKTEEIYGFI